MTDEQVKKINGVLGSTKHHYVYRIVMKLQVLMIEHNWKIQPYVGELKDSASITAVMIDILHGVGVLDIECEGLAESYKKGFGQELRWDCLLYTSPSPRDQRGSRMPSSA